MNTRWWYTGMLVMTLALGIGGVLTPRTAVACDGEEGCQVDDDIKEYTVPGEGCTRCSGDEPCGWNCHGTTSHAHGGEGGNKQPADLGLKWGERHKPQPLNEDGSIKTLQKCDIVVFGLSVPEEEDDIPPDEEPLPDFPHSATATGNGNNVWQPAIDPAKCTGCPVNACLIEIDANYVLTNGPFDGKCIVFPGSAFGNEE